PLNVLIVEDDVDTAASLAELLKMWGHEVRTAHDGPQALDSAIACVPDVALVDLALPVIDGYEVARQMRRRAGGDKLLPGAMTGYGRDDDRRLFLDAGFAVQPTNTAA